MNTISYSKTAKMMVAILAIAVLAVFALAMPAQAKSTVPPVPLLCTKNCLRVTDITLAKSKTDPAYVTAVVTLKQTSFIGNIGGVSGATVVVLWTLPDGTQIKDDGITNSKGQAVFSVEETPGVFTFTILTVQKEKFTFDSLGSVLTKSIK